MLVVLAVTVIVMAEAEAGASEAQTTEKHDSLFGEDGSSSDEEGGDIETQGSAAATTKQPSAKASADKSSAYDDEGDEDDEEAAKELVDDFIAADEDELRDAVVEEYAKQKQDFHDEYDPDFEQPDEAEKGARGAGGRGVRVVVAKMDRQTALDTLEVRFFVRACRKLKTKSRPIHCIMHVCLRFGPT